MNEQAIVESSVPATTEGHGFLRDSRRPEVGNVLNSESLLEIPVVVVAVLATVLEPDRYSLENLALVFLSGRVYDQVLRREDGPEIYSQVSDWRERVSAVIAGEFITTDGLSTIYEQDGKAGVGLARLMLLMSIYQLVDLSGRVGRATADEVEIAYGLGHEVAYIVPSSQYYEAVAFVNGESEQCPPCLPSFMIHKDLKAADLICGYDKVLSWLKQRSQTVNSEQFKGRFPDIDMLRLILRYLFYFSKKDQQTKELFKSIFEEFSKLGFVHLEEEVEQAIQLPSVVAEVLDMVFRPELVAEFRNVYLCGRVYDQARVIDGEITYEGWSKWREQVAKLIDDEFVATNGISDIHYHDERGGAGKSMLMILLSPYHLVDATGRVGNASAEEAMFAYELGHIIGVIVPEHEYANTVAYLNGDDGAAYPNCLPAYFFSTNLKTDDLICGYDGVLPWLRERRNKINEAQFRGRSPNLGKIALVLHYLFNWINQDTETLNFLEKLVAEFRDHRY